MDSLGLGQMSSNFGKYHFSDIVDKVYKANGEECLNVKYTNEGKLFPFSDLEIAVSRFGNFERMNGEIFPGTISFVPNSCTNYDLMISCDVIKQAHLNISPTGLKFSQILRPSDSANENFIMTISDDSPTFDIGPNVSQHNQSEVKQLLSTRMPKKTKTVNIELDIALTDDEPIFHKSRRLPFAE
ncbi:uncharacterized protein K02A2.6-like [Trichonephila clavipes]|uniref:Uncharacterized protein K02A2.6-like n=1 Tax=Trichonephila clavipes TaxID=2585209 RepID=A0A8X6VGW0_TRICX|nr:uncharacterized protein K02A2.6-like [Trichonephila clavipes]